MVPDVFRLPLCDLPPAWAEIAGDLITFCGVSVEESGDFFTVWQCAWRHNPKALAAKTFPPGSAILERINEGTDEDVLDALSVLANGSSYEGLEGKTVLAILKEHCPKPAKQKPLTLWQRKERVNAMRRRSR